MTLNWKSILVNKRLERKGVHETEYFISANKIQTVLNKYGAIFSLVKLTDRFIVNHDYGSMCTMWKAQLVSKRPIRQQSFQS